MLISILIQTGHRVRKGCPIVWWKWESSVCRRQNKEKPWKSKWMMVKTSLFYWNAATVLSTLCDPTCLSACLTTSRRISSHIRTREWLSSWTVWVAPETWCPRGVGVGSRSGERRCQSMVSVHTARHCCVQSRAWEWLLMTVRMLSRSVCPSMDTPPVMQNNVTGSMFSTASPHPFTTVTCAQAEPEAHLGTCGGPDNYNTGILITLVP